ncbi:uncharacterized protein LAESUDRAFT_341572 [Laetiporus sulphureus 93-53]|uniref:Uncharacterized protein n=1 Tax=Laetiporus sulphureus 93-53 TaxID=1314785 RepID=A0A165GPE8_9APHY|nr:uncharacterized protein LAESUDRAFT_341572 [Laetiporus sulphureus 93-53]KZT10626.1 hypothetical protein LAESUDRAFT_341572 [Laetiporus sulphureus 93-53]
MTATPFILTFWQGHVPIITGLPVQPSSLWRYLRCLSPGDQGSGYQWRVSRSDTRLRSASGLLVARKGNPEENER